MEKSLENDLVEKNPRKQLSSPDLSHESHKIYTSTHTGYDDESTKSVKTQFVPSEGILNSDTVREIAPQTLPYNAPSFAPPSSPPKPKSNYVLQGMCVMSLCCLGLWFWIFTYEPLTFFSSNVAADTTIEQTLLEESPVINEPIDIVDTDAKIRNVKLLQTDRLIRQGKAALKNRNAHAALVSFAKAEQTLKEMPGAKPQNSTKNLNTLKANALYLKGFQERQKENYCKAKAFLKRAKQLAPKDPKITHALEEISFLSSC